jgi:hypothetical protein
MQASHPTLCRVKERLRAIHPKDEILVEQCGIDRSAACRDHINPRPKTFPDVERAGCSLDERPLKKCNVHGSAGVTGSRRM